MNLRTLALSFVAGTASFLLVGVAVSAVAERWIEFSVYLGILAGLLAAVVVAAAVALGLADDAAGGHRRVAFAVGAFGVGFPATLVVLVLAGQGLVLSTAAGIAVGLLAGVVGYRRGPAVLSAGAT